MVPTTTTTTTRTRTRTTTTRIISTIYYKQENAKQLHFNIKRRIKL